MGDNFFDNTTLQQYVYFASLEQTHPNFAEEIKKQLTLNFRELDPETKATTTTPFFDQVQAAITKLTYIRDNEQKKEKAAIEHYKKKIESLLNNNEIKIKTIKNQLRTQLNILNHIYQNGIDDKNNFIIGINILEQDLNLFKRRLHDLSSIAETELEQQKIVSNRLEFMQEPELQSILMSSVSTTPNKIATTLSKKAEEILQNNSSLAEKCKGLPGFQKLLLGLLYIDFTNYVQNNALDFNTSVFSIDDNKLQDQLEQYIKLAFETEQSTPLIHFLTDYTNEFVKFLNDFSSFLGVEFIDENVVKYLTSSKEAREQLQSLKTEQVTKIVKSSQETIQQRIKMYNAAGGGSAFTIRAVYATSYGFAQEIRRALQKMGVDVDSNIGTDAIIPLCTFYFYLKDKPLHSTLLFMSRGINNLFKKEFQKNQNNPITRKTLKDAISAEAAVNKKVGTVIKSLHEIKKLNENGFISFESLKLSKSKEIKLSKKSVYSGRDMNILSVLTKLYAAFDNTLIDQDTLMSFLLNIHKLTLGKSTNLQDRLETYFSLFAGVLMFDDIAYMAQDALTNTCKEVAREATNTSTSILHVYNLNGIYYPLSLVLDNLIKQVEQALYNEAITTLTHGNRQLGKQRISNTVSITTKWTATATLTPPDLTDPGHGGGFNKTLWEATADKTIENTTLRINFLSGFTNYIRDLNKAMNDFK